MKNIVFFIFILLLSGCVDKPCEFSKISGLKLTKVHTDRQYIRDEYGRYVYFNGINVSGSTKNPISTSPISYVGRPFDKKDADHYFRMLQQFGFNSIRFLIMWEGIEPEQKGQYDKEYLDYIQFMVKKAAQYGIYVLLDFHQDMYSRFLKVKYNSTPFGPGNLLDMAQQKVPDINLSDLIPDNLLEDGGILYNLLSLFPLNNDYSTFDEEVKGDGAPKWAVQACMPEKQLDSPYWGVWQGLGNFNIEILKAIGQLLNQDAIVFLSVITNQLKKFDPTQSMDMLPFTTWGVNFALSYSLERNFGCMMAGKKIYPDLIIKDKSDNNKDKNIQDYLQEAYAGAWVQVAKQVKDMPNVIGYDIMNEPGGMYIMMSLLAGITDLGLNAKSLIVNLLGEELGLPIYNLLTGLNFLPRIPDATDPDYDKKMLEIKKKYGLDKLDAFNSFGLNIGYDKNYMQPFYERIGRAILDVDQDALIWIEPSMGLNVLGGEGAFGGQMEQNMTRPQFYKNDKDKKDKGQVVFVPHVYADIYPFPGFNAKPRDFIQSEVKYRDYSQKVKSVLNKAQHSLGNVPSVIGEFGTYFNFNGIENSIANNYKISGEILDNYYEAMEKLFVSRFIWCFSKDNSYKQGEGWNHEDFSIIGPDQKPRAQKAWSRPYPRAVSGKPVSMHFYSPYHYFDPEKGIPNHVGEFELVFESRETDAPTEIFVPKIQYPDGFYVWISDGYCLFDPDTQILYFYPTQDEPKTNHRIKLLPPIKHNVNSGWSYFFKGNYVLTGNKGN